MLALIRFTFRWSLRILALAIVLTVALLAFRDVLLREWLVYRLGTVTGLETHLAGASIDPQRRSITLDHLEIRNSPDFGGSLLLAIPELQVEIDTAALAHREIRLRRARLHLAEVSAVRSADGRTNVYVLQDAVTRNASLVDLALLSPPGFTFTGIETLDLTLGTLHLVDLAPPGIHQPIVVGVTNEILHDVRSTADFNPLILRVLFREITAGFTAGLRTNSASTKPRPPSATPPPNHGR